MGRVKCCEAFARLSTESTREAERCARSLVVDLRSPNQKVRNRRRSCESQRVWSLCDRRAVMGRVKCCEAFARLSTESTREAERSPWALVMALAAMPRWAGGLASCLRLGASRGDVCRNQVEHFSRSRLRGGAFCTVVRGGARFDAALRTAMWLRDGSIGGENQDERCAVTREARACCTVFVMALADSRPRRFATSAVALASMPRSAMAASEGEIKPSAMFGAR